MLRTYLDIRGGGKCSVKVRAYLIIHAISSVKDSAYLIIHTI